MTRTITQRLTIMLPLLGVAFLVASMLLPVQFAVVAWGFAMISFLVALACAIAFHGRREHGPVSTLHLTPSPASPEG